MLELERGPVECGGLAAAFEPNAESRLYLATRLDPRPLVRESLMASTLFLIFLEQPWVNFRLLEKPR